ncbi:MAG: glutamine-hydrolyzing carbamoyl-phosphate synthase small subunit [Planctomycetes bacterium]|nr:glutamine-hydrolyzing carbamoyl-phosphate synthase small subunit [Planctomycetota bacterium]
MRAKLALEDGTVLNGNSFGAEGERAGEVVFNTSMTGYQEILTDPSYRGQIVTMTYPLIGNYGVNSEDIEARGPQPEGFVVREASRVRSNYRSSEDLGTWLKRAGVVGIEGVDTRLLTLRLREKGALRGVISTADVDDASLVVKARNSPGMVGRDLVREVTPKEAFPWHERTDGPLAPVGLPPSAPDLYKVAAIDYGVKYSSLRHLTRLGCKLTVLPATVTGRQVLDLKPDGVFLSNGPGDPAALDYAAACVRDLAGRVPVFGICLGLQIIAHGLGGKTFKLKFGHHGGNHPVKNLRTGRVEITAQNHGFAVDPDSLGKTGLDITHLNLNDQTVEGLEHKSLPLFCVQYHPEAGPGPHDSLYLFRKFIQLMADRNS